MALSTTLKLKIFYFEIEILQEQAFLFKNGLDYSLEAVRSRLRKTTAELYLKSNLLVTDSYYEQHPFRLSIVMEGTELKKSEAISSSHHIDFHKEKFTVLVVEVIGHLSPTVKQKILKSGYTMQDVAKEIVLNIWQYSIHSKPDLAIVFNDLRNQPSHCRLQKVHYDHNLSIITDIVFGLK